MTVNVESVAERVAGLRSQIEQFATRSVRIVAVTKRFGPAAVEAALAAGVDDIGESYAQELVEKATALQTVGGRQPRWHFVGHVQRNKVRTVANMVDLWHSVDSLRLGREIATRAPDAAVLVQVNLSRVSSQSGVAAADVHSLVDDLRELAVNVRGLMAIGAADDLAATATMFGRLRSLADDLELPECSMGMSADVKEALLAGSTLLRVGTGLFGARPI